MDLMQKENHHHRNDTEILVNKLNVAFQRFVSIYDDHCQICCNWFRFTPGVSKHTKAPCRKINMIFTQSLYANTGPTSPALALKW